MKEVWVKVKGEELERIRKDLKNTKMVKVGC
jgi:hypothetical protein